MSYMYILSLNLKIVYIYIYIHIIITYYTKKLRGAWFGLVASSFQDLFQYNVWEPPTLHFWAGWAAWADWPHRISCNIMCFLPQTMLRVSFSPGRDRIFPFSGPTLGKRPMFLNKSTLPSLSWSRDPFSPKRTLTTQRYFVHCKPLYLSMICFI